MGRVTKMGLQSFAAQTCLRRERASGPYWQVVHGRGQSEPGHAVCFRKLIQRSGLFRSLSDKGCQ
jgi:hypothetical protein